jgi:hypothetical protein
MAQSVRGSRAVSMLKAIVALGLCDHALRQRAFTLRIAHRKMPERLQVVIRIRRAGVLF